MQAKIELRLVREINLKEAFKRPFTDIKKLVIGILIGMIPLVNLIMLGYIVECAKSAMNKEYKLPQWRNWWDLFGKGSCYITIIVAYTIPVAVIMALAGLYGNLFILAIVYIALSAIMLYVLKDRFSAAFNFGEVFDKALRGSFFIICIIMAMYYLVLETILSPFDLIDIPFLLSPGMAITGFIWGVTAMTAFGELYPKL